MSLRRFVIWRPENGQDEDDGKTVCAYNAEEAVEQISIARLEDTRLGDRMRVYRKHVVIELQDLAGEGWAPTS